MSYINQQSTALIKVKLTDIGREQLAKGQLTFSNYVLGDSEVDYEYVKGWATIRTKLLVRLQENFIFPKQTVI